MLDKAEDSSLLLIRDLVEQSTGLYFQPATLSIFGDHIENRMHALRLESALDYLYFLKWDPQKGQEWRRLISLLTVNETSFWREADAVQLCTGKLLRRMSDNRRFRPLRVWHAACSTGEEPYSLAMSALREGWKPGLDLEILASDIDTRVISGARMARYGSRALRNLPEDMREQYVLESGDGYHQLTEELRDSVRFFTFNLIDNEAGLAPTGCDIIFCRNVLIYFRDETIKKVAELFWRSLVPGGFLILGASESLLRFKTRFITKTE